MLEGRICDVDPQQVLMPGRLHCFFNRGSGKPASLCRIGAEAGLYARQRSRMTGVP